MKKIVTLCLLTLAQLNAQGNYSNVQIESWKEYSKSLALQAATYASPLVTMYALRHHDAVGPNAKAQPNTIWNMTNISTPELSKEAGYVTPNVNTIYGFGFMDLRQEPIILQVPNSNNRYYMIEIVDMWTNAFAYVGGKATGYQGGTFAIVGPNWKGELPAGVKRIDSPTSWILLQPRVHIYKEGHIDLAGAQKILQGIVPMPLSQFLGKTAPKVTYNYPAPATMDPNQPVSALDFKDPLQFWELFSNALNENPPPKDQIDALLPLFAPLGIELGKQWNRSQVNPVTLESMKEAAQRVGTLFSNMPFNTVFEGAFLPPAFIGDFGTHYFTRAVIARIGLTANTPYEAIYWMYPFDKNSQPLTGAQKYTMTFKEGLPYFEPGFWSITMYDSTNNYTVSNPINRYMLGSDTPEIQKNKDGSFTLYIQKESPGKEKETNWLPTPEGPFYLIMRSYAPKPQTIEILKDVNAWPIPFLEPAHP